MAFSTQDAVAAFNHAEALFRDGRYDHAFDILVDLNGKYPHNKNILYPMALCLEKTGDRGKAAHICNQLIVQFNDPRAVRMVSRLGAIAETARPAERPPEEHAKPDPVFGVLFGEHTRILGMASATLSAGALILANLMPLIGVVCFKWDVFIVLLVFWMENVVVGIFNMLKMAVSQEGDLLNTVSKLFLIPFFALHYSVFCLAHLFFLCMLFGSTFLSDLNGGPPLPSGSGNLSHFHHVIASLLEGGGLPDFIYVAAAGLFFSHGVSLVANFLWNGEYRRVSASELMQRPYGRVSVMHITILAGGMIVGVTGSAQSAIAVLVLFKIAMDFTAHMSERRSFGS